jgi:SOS response regulatory protein OraA/RecX
MSLIVIVSAVLMTDASNLEESENNEVTPYLRVEKVALRLIARAEQCTGGLTRKLEKRGFDSACIDEVISKLTELKLLDDNRFSRLWLESRLRLPRSPRRLLISLCARGIDHDDAQTALKNVLDEDTELALLARFAKKYSRKAKGEPRLLKHLLKNEGFSRGAINRFLGEE